MLHSEELDRVDGVGDWREIVLCNLLRVTVTPRPVNTFASTWGALRRQMN